MRTLHFPSHPLATPRPGRMVASLCRALCVGPGFVVTLGLIATLGFVTTLGFVATSAQAITVSAFGPNGTGGSLNGQRFDVGSDADVFELEAIVGTGDSAGGARLSSEAAPVGLSIVFASERSADTTDLVLRYTLTNTSASVLSDVYFVSFLDAEIAETTNTFFNEFATTRGSLAAGQSFEVDEPGYVSGDIFDNARAGALDGTNVLDGPLAADDVSLALGWTFGSLGVGTSETIEFMLSEDGDMIGDFAIDQFDGAPNASPTVLTYSSRRVISAPIPEPSAWLLFGAGAAFLSTRFRPAPSR